MKRRDLFWKLLPLYLFLCLLAVGLSFLLAQNSYKKFYYKETLNRLSEKARIISPQISQLLENKNTLKLSAYILKISKLTEDRITLVSPNGKVLVDSQKDPKFLDSLASRKEIKEALSGINATSFRVSESLNSHHLYLALPVKVKGEIRAVLRHSVEIDRLDSAFLSYSRNVVWLLLGLLVLLTVIIIWHTKIISTPLEEMRRHAEKLSQGSFSQKIHIKKNAPIEVYKLAKTLTQMGHRIDRQLNKIVKQKSELDTIFNSMGEGVVTVDLSCNLFHVNSMAMKMFDKNLELQNIDELKGKPLEELVRIPLVAAIAKETIEAGVIIEREITLPGSRTLQVKSSVLETPNLEQIGVVLVFNDISRIRELEDHRKEFVANVSHELRTPLTSIGGFVETLLESDIEDQSVRDKFLRIIKDQTGRLENLIEDLLTISELENDREVKLSVQAINPVIIAAIETCQKRATSQNVDLNFIGNKNLFVHINSSLLEQAIINLIENAIRYGGSNKKVEISCLETEEHITISVIDEGPGIAEEHHERLFERLYSIDKARSREHGGSGIGLSIVKHISILHGGDVNLVSSLGKGSNFQIILPKTSS